MSLSDKLLRVERHLERRLSRVAGRSAMPRETFEIVAALVEEIAGHAEPAGGGVRVFPYNRVAVRLVVPPGRSDAARAVLEHGATLAERVRRRLEEQGCRPPVDLRVSVRIAEGEAQEGQEFALGLARRAGAPAEPVAVAPEPPRVRLVVLAGDAGERSRLLARERIHVGRMSAAVDRRNRVVRRNELAFADAEDGVNATVSRAHAHLEWIAAEGAYRLFDDGSAQRTHVEREGCTIEVPPRSAHGVLLRTGDVLCFGQARVRFAIED